MVGGGPRADARARTSSSSGPRTDSAALNDRLDGLRVSVLDENRKPVWTTVDRQGPRAKRWRSCPAGRRSVPLNGRHARASRRTSSASPRRSTATPAQDSGWAVAPQFGKAARGGRSQTTRRRRRRRRRAGDADVHAHAELPEPRRSAGSASPRRPQPRPVRELPGDVADARRDRAGRSARRSRRRRLTRLLQVRRAAPRSRSASEIAQLEQGAGRDQAAAGRRSCASCRRTSAATTHLLVKGNFLEHGRRGRARRARGVPPAARRTRRRTASALAKWLVDPENPLTARVAVNRFWAQLFGTGSSRRRKTSARRASRPRHPELLDWLAVDVPRRPEVGHEGAAEADRDVGDLPPVVAGDARAAGRRTRRNRLLDARPRLRLEAEMVRDQALALSGLLSRKMFGPSRLPAAAGRACGRRRSTASGPTRPAPARTATAAGCTRSGGGRCRTRRWRRSTRRAARRARSAGSTRTRRSRRS